MPREKKVVKPITAEGSTYDLERIIMMLKLPSNSLEKISGLGNQEAILHALGVQVKLLPHKITIKC